MASLPLHDHGRAAVSRGERATGAVRERHVAVLHLHLGMAFAAMLPDRFDSLRETAAVRGMIIAEAAAVRVERQLAASGDQVAARHELPASAFRAEAEILERDEHGDREAVVD